MLAQGVRRCSIWRFGQQCGYSRAVVVKEGDGGSIPFPRERDGLSYALNWALAAKAIPPQGDVFHNLENSELEKHGANSKESASGSKVYGRGSFSSGVAEISKAQFNKLFREITQHLSSRPKLFVNDGAIGSSPRVDVKARSICDNSSASWVFKNTLYPASIRGPYDEIPLTIYVASEHKSTAVEDSSFLAADYDRSALVIVGNAFADHAAVKQALEAFAAPAAVASGSLPLRARVVSVGDSKVIISGPEAILSKTGASVFPEPGIIWNANGVSRLFSSSKSGVPDSVSPTALVLITVDSTGALPGISQINPDQAAFHYLAGYDGEAFSPCYNKTLSVNAVTLASELSKLLTSTKVPAFLVNASDGQKQVSDKELMKLVEAAATGKLPKTKQPNGDAVQALTEKYTGFVSKKFPNLPESMKP